MAGRAPGPIVTTYEYERVHLPSEVDTPNVRERLVAAGVQAGLRAFETRNRRLYALGAVGVVDIGDVIVEVLPKTGESPTRAAGAAFLAQLLRFAGNGASLGLIDADIASGDGGLLEIIYTWGLRNAVNGLRDGPPRRYAVREELTTAVRGRVELRHLVRQRPGRAFEITVRFAPLGEDNLLGRIVKWVIAQIVRRTRNYRSRTLGKQLLDDLTGVRDQDPTERELDRLSLSFSEARWASIVTLARIFLDGGVPDPTRGGRLPAVAVLFTLHGLFEGALRKILNNGFPPIGLALRSGRRHLLSGVGDTRSVLLLRPDFRADHADGGAISLAGDAKWKRILGSDGSMRLGEDDAYQVTAYVAALEADAGFIVCPLQEHDTYDIRRVSYEISGLARPFEIFGVRLSKLISDDAAGVDLRHRLCHEIAELTRLSEKPLSPPREISTSR